MSDPNYSLGDDHIPLRWKKAAQQNVQMMRQDTDGRARYIAAFEYYWTDRLVDGQPVPLPANWRTLIGEFFDRVLPLDTLLKAIAVTMDDRRVAADPFRFLYYLGRESIREMEVFAVEALERGDV